MALSVADIYSLRECVKIVLPLAVEGHIAKLRRTAMVFKPFHKPQRLNPPRIRPVDNWREKALIECVRKVKEREDPEYSEIFSIFNKITKTTLEKLSNDAIALIQKRDETFRLRVCTLLFDKAIVNHGFASVMADCALILSKSIPEVVEDLSVQVSMFDTLYNTNDTIACTPSTIVEWTTQKEKRRGYAKFVTELNIRNLITDECVQKGLEDVLGELANLLGMAKSPQTEENIHQCAVFLFETLKIIPAKNTTCRTLLKNSIREILASKPPTLNMKTKFKLEDALKLVS
jgi:hypothetical protein